jgi:hypothetical protein
MILMTAETFSQADVAFPLVLLVCLPTLLSLVLPIFQGYLFGQYKRISTKASSRSFMSPAFPEVRVNFWTCRSLLFMDREGS